MLSIRRATKLATAMEARGFGSGAPRSQARISRLKPIDWIFYVICLAVPLASIGVAVGTGNWHFAFRVSERRQTGTVPFRVSERRQISTVPFKVSERLMMPPLAGAVGVADWGGSTSTTLSLATDVMTRQ